MGYRIGLAEIAAEGYDPGNFFASVEFTQTPDINPTLMVCGDQLETKLLFNNLLGNVATAAKQSDTPFVHVTASARDARIDVVIENSGQVLSDEEVAQITVPFISSSGTGLGLGVPISMSLAEASGGRLRFERRDEGGLRAIVTLRAG